jgi:ubiquinone/menaquinone biosynthesis C-methylase UbiE
MFARQHVRGRIELPVLYDAAQIVFGGRRTLGRVGELLDRIGPASVLDVGGGTGFYAAAVPPSARYVVADTDAAKLARLRKRVPRAEAVLADATRLPVRAEAFELALFIAVAHHLSDEALELALTELARVTRGCVLVVEPLSSTRRAAQILWRLDQGTFPRSAEALTALLTERFEPEHVERYSIHHDYLLWLGRPRVAAAV